jgi:hypothetical protein
MGYRVYNPSDETFLKIEINCLDWLATGSKKTGFFTLTHILVI